MVTPAKLFVPVNELVPFSKATLADNCASAMFPVTLAAVVAVAALPEMLIAAVPALKFVGFKFVKPCQCR